MIRAQYRAIWTLLGLGLLMVAVQGFAWPSVWRGVAGLVGDTGAQGRLAGSLMSNVSISVHMVSGGVITVLAVVQWAAPVRHRWPKLHRRTGRILAPLALLTGAGGLAYILLRGTIGGFWMSTGFALYGTLMALAAVQTLRFAVQRDRPRHRAWGLRLIILSLGSWLYRVHYGVWYGVTCGINERICGLGSRPDFLGPFDLVQNFAFYLPYLALVEWHLRQR